MKRVICCLLVLFSIFHEFASVNGATEMSKLIGVDFEVFGRVQGVCFRMYTQKRGEKLGLKGFCMNTQRGTVVGRMEGEKSKVDEMKHWLQYTGSPQSAIDKAEFRNEQDISNFTYSGFEIH